MPAGAGYWLCVWLQDMIFGIMLKYGLMDALIVPRLVRKIFIPKNQKAIKIPFDISPKLWYCTLSVVYRSDRLAKRIALFH